MIQLGQLSLFVMAQLATRLPFAGVHIRASYATAPIQKHTRKRSKEGGSNRVSHLSAKRMNPFLFDSRRRSFHHFLPPLVTNTKTHF